MLRKRFCIKTSQLLRRPTFKTPSWGLSSTFSTSLFSKSEVRRVALCPRVCGLFRGPGEGGSSHSNLLMEILSSLPPPPGGEGGGYEPSTFFEPSITACYGAKQNGLYNHAHCKDTTTKIRETDIPRIEIERPSAPIFTCMCLWAIFIFPWTVANWTLTTPI
jgi:hypothetical protein